MWLLSGGGGGLGGNGGCGGDLDDDKVLVTSVASDHKFFG